MLVVDAFDSFVDILRQYLMSAGAVPIMVRSDKLRLEEVPLLRPDGILLGPGPGHPDVSGHVEIVRSFAGRLPCSGCVWASRPSPAPTGRACCRPTI